MHRSLWPRSSGPSERLITPPEVPTIAPVKYSGGVSDRLGEGGPYFPSAQAGSLFLHTSVACRRASVYASNRLLRCCASGVPAGSCRPADRRSSTSGSVVFRGRRRRPHGTELWKSDGTAAGTKLRVQGHHPGPGASALSNPTAVGQTVFFTVADGERQEFVGHRRYGVRDADAPGRRLPRLQDGLVQMTAAGSAPCSSPIPTPPAGSRSGRVTGPPPGRYAELHDFSGHRLPGLHPLHGRRRRRLLLRGRGGRDAAVVAERRTAVGTVRLADVAPSRRQPGLAGDITVEAGPSTSTRTTASTESSCGAATGTAAGTRMVRDVNPGPADSWPRQITVAGGRLHFSADDGRHGEELGPATAPQRARGWSATSTPRPAGGAGLGRRRVPVNPSHLTAVGDAVFFVADNSTTAASCGRPTARSKGRPWSVTSGRSDRRTSRPSSPRRAGRTWPPRA